MCAAPISIFADAQPPKTKRSTAEMARRLLSKAEQCQGLQQNTSAGFYERLQMSGDLGRRELIKPVYVSRSLVFPFLDGNIEDQSRDTVKQRGNHAHLGYHRRSPKRPGQRLAKNGVILLERAVGSFGCRAQSMQVPIPFRASGDLQDETGTLSNRHISRESRPVGTMRKVPAKLKSGSKLRFHSSLETGE